MKTILWAEEVNKASIPQVGGKGANLGEMLNAKMPVPQAFIVTAEAFDHFVTSVGIKDDIMDILSKVKVDDEKSLTGASKSVREVVRNAKIPWNLEVDIVGAYKKLSEIADEKEAFVAVRSSATAEDLPEASFAGQQETFLNVHTKEDLLDPGDTSPHLTVHGKTTPPARILVLDGEVVVDIPEPGLRADLPTPHGKGTHRMLAQDPVDHIEVVHELLDNEIARKPPIVEPVA